ncbi:MAG: hypothetical protein U9O98_01945, partial [Asgard group archaeon]|nr:hypothetical protein [Asgard group archaeon]
MDEQITPKKDNDIIKIFTFTCDKCNKLIEVPIKKSQSSKIIGGIFRIITIHQCNGQKMAVFLFFDDNLILRQKVSSPIISSDINDTKEIAKKEEILDKQVAMIKYLYKTFGDDFAKVINAIFTGEVVIIIGEKLIKKPTCECLKLFAKNRKLEMSSNFNKKSSTDIICMENYPKENFTDSVIIDLKKKKILNGHLNSFCVELLYMIINMEVSEIVREHINNQILKIKKYVNDITKAMSITEADAFFSALGMSDLIPDFVDILLIVSSKINPYIGKYYRMITQQNNNRLEARKPILTKIKTKDAKINFKTIKKDPLFTLEKHNNLFHNYFDKHKKEKHQIPYFTEFSTPLYSYYLISIKDHYKGIKSYRSVNNEKNVLTNPFLCLSLPLETKIQSILKVDEISKKDIYNQLSNRQIQYLNSLEIFEHLNKDPWNFSVVIRNFYESPIRIPKIKSLAYSFAELMRSRINESKIQISRLDNLVKIVGMKP